MSFELKHDNGKSSVYIDGVLTPPILYGLSDIPGSSSNTHYAYTNIRNFAKKGITIVSADASIHTSWHKYYPFDTEEITAEIEAVLDANPNAKVLLRLHMNPPYWWLRDNPDECVVYRTPDGDVEGIDDGGVGRLIQHDLDKNIRVSLASEKWLREATEKLVIFLESVKDSRVSDALIGIQVACGVYGEWHQWGCDVSAPMRRRFSRFLKEKYKSVGALRSAWGDENVDFENAEFCPEPFTPTDDGAFRDPVLSRSVMDSQECIQKTTPEAIIHFATAIKKVMPHVLCGAFYGYYFNTDAVGVIGGHLAIEELYSSDKIDFLCGPFCYMKNRLPDGVPMQRAFLESHRLRKKLWLTEMDQFPIGVEYSSGGLDEYFDTNVAILRRNTLQPIFAGQGFWYYDHRMVPGSHIDGSLGKPDNIASSIYRKRGWWDTPRMMDEIGKIQDFCKKFAARHYSNDADVLIVCDAKEKVSRHKSKHNDDDYALIEGIARCGVAYDVIYLSDFDICESERYKAIIFARCPTITPQIRRKIEERMKGKMCIFLNATGYSDGTTLSTDNLRELMKCKFVRTEAKTITFNTDKDAIEILGGNSPLFAIENEENILPLAYYDNGKIAAARNKNSVYISLPYIPEKMAKELLYDTGVHFYTEGSPVFAASGLVAVNCQTAGEQTVRLKNGETLQFVTSTAETAVFDVETKERLL